VDDLIGTVCVGSLGRVGLVVRISEIEFPGSGDKKKMFEGIGLDGKGLWCASNPLKLYDNIEQYMDRLAQALKQPGCVYPPLGCGSLNPIGC